MTLTDTKGSAAGKMIGKLLRDGLVEEVPAGASMPVWRRDDDAGPLSRGTSSWVQGNNQSDEECKYPSERDLARPA